MELLSERPPGPLSVRDLTIEAIAKRAGVGKTTIYRWWPSKAAVVIDSFLDVHVTQTPLETEGSVVAALRKHVRSVAEIYAGPEGRLIAQLIAECQYDPATLQEFRERFWDGRVESVIQLIERGIRQGEFRSDVDPWSMAELIYAPIYMRLLFRSGPLDDEFTTRLVTVALEGVRQCAARPDAPVEAGSGAISGR
jgi:AcrR family transcriptional regulator